MRFPDSNRFWLVWLKFCFWSFLLATLGGSRNGRPLLAAAPEPAVSARVDGRVWDDTANGRAGNFLVLLAEQADTGVLSKHQLERRVRRHAVVAALRETASRSQAPIRGV